MKEVYQMKKEELLLEFPDVDGLTEEKAKRILEEKGENVLEETAKKIGFSTSYFSRMFSSESS